MPAGQELYEHVLSLANDLDVDVWAHLNSPHSEAGEAILTKDGRRMVWLAGVPESPSVYLVALHELGHHADPTWKNGLALDHEARAWRWALKHSLVEVGRTLWAMISDHLHDYAADKRYKRTSEFNSLLAEAITGTEAAR